MQAAPLHTAAQVLTVVAPALLITVYIASNAACGCRSDCHEQSTDSCGEMNYISAGRSKITMTGKVLLAISELVNIHVFILSTVH